MDCVVVSLKEYLPSALVRLFSMIEDATTTTTTLPLLN